MKKDKYPASRLLTLAGALMTVSGILMALCESLAIGGMLWAGAACLLLGAYHLRLSENEKEKKEDCKDDEATL